MHLKYRADIDGLRAIAVMSVVIYHAKIKIFSGGYVGVDIFFVISGYLITTIIVNELDKNSFSLIEFYERRVRRIFPALFVTLFATGLISAFLFDGNAFQDVGKTLVYTTLFTSNILFWTQSGYFDRPSDLNPLLHTWSLAVEEQFYILFPLLLIILYRYWRSAMKPILLVVTLVSFLLNIYELNQNPSAAFYLTHMRVWELLIGCLLAVRLVPVNIKSQYRELLSAIGMILLVIAIFSFTTDIPFPGFAALMPTIGAALLIYSGIENTTKLGRVLSFRPMVFIGKISYSLYLIHWPVLVFVRYYTIVGLKPVEKGAISLLIFMLAILSWNFIESPFRRAKRKYYIFNFAAITMTITLTVGVYAFTYYGSPERQLYLDLSRANIKGKNWKNCNFGPEVNFHETPSLLDSCILGKGTNDPTFLLWGDSHAGVLITSLQISALKNSANGLVAYSSGGCQGLLGVDWEGRSCANYNQGVIDYLQDHPNIETVILASRWAIYAEGTRYKDEEGSSVVLVDSLTGMGEVDGNGALFKLGMEKTINTLLQMNRRVVVVLQVPEIGYDVPSAYSMARRLGQDLNETIAPGLDEYLQRNKLVISAVEKFSYNTNVLVVEPHKVLCYSYKCFVVIDGQPLYHDNNHLSAFGAEYISPLFDNILEARH